MSRNEANTRKEIIDKALEKAGWSLDDSNQVGMEIPVDGYDAEPWNGVTDYCLYLPNGEVIAVVEAKRQSRDPRVAEQQVRHYVTEIEKHQSFRPFAFMSNGDRMFFWDVGNENKRPVAGFFSLRDLQNLLYIRQNKIPLQQLSVNLAIANRAYQQEAIGRVSERFDEGHRRALVVMATGTGKTRTIMALIEVFLRANQARTVLFVADRDALVRQALDENFKVYLPSEPRDRIRTYNVDYSKRLYVGSSFERYMQNAEFKVSKSATLIEVCNLIDALKISEQNQDVQGDLYEYLLSKLSTAGRNGQFRTPRHIIRMMVRMVDPKPKERIGDLAAGTCGFPVNAYEYILEQHSEPDEQGNPQLIGDLLSDEERECLQTEAFTAYDNDAGMTMLRIGSMNLMLHGIKHPRFFYMDTLSKAFNDEKSLDVVLMNPPFKGKMDESDINPTLPTKCKKTELLFLHLIERVLDMGGRCAVIVPDGVLFGSSKQHQEIRKKIIETHRLDGVVSMPSGVFKPYAGVSTAVLLFTRGGTTDKIWFYDMEHDGFSLDDTAVSDSM
ncbi:MULTISPECIES: N-6 DNA methylase [unclassified Coleofasciculus]|uniref:N-6 DNA methylase n=1 Tax=unclassified Coleofasciculus TaxID=2692782 RepID=UPI001D1405B9|nr:MULTISPECIES: N-6 DNA methylase [unclassified Coleofasciculus]